MSNLNWNAMPFGFYDKNSVKKKKFNQVRFASVKAPGFVSGTYVIRMQYGKTTQSKKMTVIR